MPDRPTFSEWCKQIKPQTNLERARQLAVAELASQTADQLIWLGAEPVGQQWRLEVLDGVFQVDIDKGEVITAEGAKVGPAWQILTLHYLAVRARPEPQVPEVTFADLPTARSYNDVFQHRTTGRLCATVGRSADTLRKAAESLGGRAIPGGDLAYHFRVFPRVHLRLIWYAPDEEFPPSAVLLLPQNIEQYFCSEDIVVLCERFVSRLCGRPF